LIAEVPAVLDQQSGDAPAAELERHAVADTQ
jgi:hypothetical protein